MTEALLIGAGAVVGLFALWAFACAPARTRRRARPWAGTRFAHRGLYGAGAPENSLAAFERACAAEVGIELDVLSTRDGALVVFHDDDALRMTGDARLIRDMTLAEVQQLRLSGSGEGIPTFDEVLDLVRGRVPLLVEVKSAPSIGELTRRVADRLKDYEGRFLMESFNPLSLFWLRRHAPWIVRGQLVQGYADFRKTTNPATAFVLSGILYNLLSRPDFLAYGREMRRSPALWLHRRVFRTPLAVWTVSDAREARALSERGEMPIFEHIDPRA